MEFVHSVEAELCLQEGIAAAAVCPFLGFSLTESPGAGPWGALGVSQWVTSFLWVHHSCSSLRCVCQGWWSPCSGAVSAGSTLSCRAPEEPFLLSLICFLLVPCPNLYMQLNGLMLTLDTPSVLWINLFCLDLCRSLEQFKAIYKLEDSGKRDEHVDVRLDGFRLKVPSFPFLFQSSVFSL